MFKSPWDMTIKYFMYPYFSTTQILVKDDSFLFHCNESKILRILHQKTENVLKLSLYPYLHLFISQTQKCSGNFSLSRQFATNNSLSAAFNPCTNKNHT